MYTASRRIVMIGWVACALFLSGCATNREYGSALGGVAGAIIGGQLGSGVGSVATSALGSIAGSWAGSLLGSRLDDYERIEYGGTDECRIVQQKVTRLDGSEIYENIRTCPNYRGWNTY